MNEFVCGSCGGGAIEPIAGEYEYCPYCGDPLTNRVQTGSGIIRDK